MMKLPTLLLLAVTALGSPLQASESSVAALRRTRTDDTGTFTTFTATEVAVTPFPTVSPVGTDTTVILPSPTGINPNPNTPIPSPAVDEGKWKFALEWLEVCDMVPKVSVLHWNLFTSPDNWPFTNGDKYASMTNFNVKLGMPPPGFTLEMGPERNDQPGTVKMHSTYGKGCSWEFGAIDPKDGDCGGCYWTYVHPADAPALGPAYCPPSDKYYVRTRKFDCWQVGPWNHNGRIESGSENQTTQDPVKTRHP